MKIDDLDHPIVSTKVDKRRYLAAVLDDADLVGLPRINRMFFGRLCVIL